MLIKGYPLDSGSSLHVLPVPLLLNCLPVWVTWPVQGCILAWWLLGLGHTSHQPHVNLDLSFQITWLQVLPHVHLLQMWSSRKCWAASSTWHVLNVEPQKATAEMGKTDSAVLSDQTAVLPPPPPLIWISTYQRLGLTLRWWGGTFRQRCCIV